MTDGTPVTVYVSIGNSDDKLTQVRWSEYCDIVTRSLRAWDGIIYGEWYSLPTSPYQNACWCVAIPQTHLAAAMRALRTIAGMFRQDAITWAPAPEVIMLGPETHGPNPA